MLSLVGSCLAATLISLLSRIHFSLVELGRYKMEDYINRNQMINIISTKGEPETLSDVRRKQ